jgi:hypothetical protein
MAYEFQQSISNQQIRDVGTIKTFALGSNVKNKDLTPIPLPEIAEVRRRIDAGETKATAARDNRISRETLYNYLKLEKGDL